MPLTVEQAQAQALAEVQAYCRWHIAPERSDELVLDGPGTPVILLPSLHVESVEEVLEADQVADSEGYQWSASGIIVRTGGCWTDKLRGVVVRYTHGYASMPPDVATVLDRVAARALELSEASQILSQVGQVRYAVGVDGLREVGLLADADRLVLDRYRLPFRL